MNPLAVGFLLVALVLGGMVFWLARSADWHWGVGLLLAAVPVALTFLFGMLGLLASALFVGAIYRAAA